MEYLLRTEWAAAVGEVVESPDVDLHVPALCDVEVGAALRRALLARRMVDSRANEALDDYLDLPIHRHGHGSLLKRTLELRANLSAYDAIYVALAERLDARLLTADRRLRRAVKTHSAVEVVPNVP